MRVYREVTLQKRQLLGDDDIKKSACFAYSSLNRPFFVDASQVSSIEGGMGGGSGTSTRPSSNMLHHHPTNNSLQPINNNTLHPNITISTANEADPTAATTATPSPSELIMEIKRLRERY